jgi:tRNA threonylcarbamoyladenosine biosynthesis protein TsaB
VNVIAIETATETVGVAVGTESGVQAAFTLQGRRRHVESLTPAIEHLLTQVGLVAADLSAVAVDLGPGLFTGLRVGVASAKGLAQALGIGVIGLTSLDILARAAADAGHAGPVAAVVDARRGEVFAAVTGGGAKMLGPALYGPDDLAQALAGLGVGPITAVGDGALRYATVIGAVSGVTVVTGDLTHPPPQTLLAMARRLLEEGAPPVDPGGVVPIYMRDADAKSNFAQIARA